MTTEELSKVRAKAGRMGGLKKVPKGIAKLSEEERIRLSKKGVEARRRKREQVSI